jgi:hypothetical protein
MAEIRLYVTEPKAHGENEKELQESDFCNLDLGGVCHLHGLRYRIMFQMSEISSTLFVLGVV